MFVISDLLAILVTWQFIKSHQDKWKLMVIACVFIGYPFVKKTYKLFSLNDRKIYVSRDVVFHKALFPFKNQNHDLTTSPILVLHPDMPCDPHLKLPLPQLSDPATSNTSSLSHMQSPNPISQSLRKTTRISQPPFYLKDHICAHQCHISTANLYCATLSN